jgi:hypothetical protein
MPTKNKFFSKLLCLYISLQRQKVKKKSQNSKIKFFLTFFARWWFLFWFLYYCITVSGSNFLQLLAAWKKRRKSPNLLEGLEPPAYQVSNGGAPSPKGARPSWKGRAPQQPAPSYLLHTSTELSPSTPHGLGPPSSTCTISWSILPPHTKAMGGPHTPPPLLAWNPLMRSRGTVF